MISANQIFLLRQKKDSSHPLYQLIGMTTTQSDVESQIEAISNYRFQEIFYISAPDQDQQKRLSAFDVRLTQLALEKKENDPTNTLYCINHVEQMNHLDCDDRILWIFDGKNKTQTSEIKSKIAQYNNLYFYFPPKQFLGDGLLSCRQIQSILRETLPQMMRPYPGLNVFEPKAPPDLIFYPRGEVMWSQGFDEQIDHTIIIPVYGQKHEALRTVERLLFQTSLEKYEILLVDDGENEDLSLRLRNLLSQKHQVCSFKYLVNPRIYPRQMGDHRFRAGISRNFALRFAKGNLIHFLDADVLVPRTYLDTISEEMQNADLVQIQRYDLTQFFTQSQNPIEDVIMEKDVLMNGREYWYDFFKQGEQWMQLKCPWKYVCTYGISMRRDYLMSLGGIRTNYIFYGFEDTDLGYRVWRSGGRLKLSSVLSYHQFHQEKRSEFKNSNRLRRRLMSQSGKLFFLNHLDPKIYDELIDYLFPRYSISEWLNFLFVTWWSKPKKNNPQKIANPLVN